MRSEASEGRRGGVSDPTGVLVCGGALVLFLAAAGCSGHVQPVEGCGSDRDCKGERICEPSGNPPPAKGAPFRGGRCVWPSRPGEATVGQTSYGIAAERVPPVAAQTPSDVPPAQGMFRLDPQHRGRSPFRISQERPQIRWVFETGGPVSSSPALAADDMVVVASHDHRVYGLDPSGKAHWSFVTGDLMFSSPSVSAAGTTFVGSDDDYLYALDGKTGKSLWKLRAGTCSQTVGLGPEASRCDADGGPTLGPDGTIYFGGDAVYAVNPDGSLRWRFATGGHVATAPAVLPDGSVVVGSRDNNVYLLNRDGTKRWDFRTRGDVESTPAIEEDGTIYVGSDDNKLYALSSLGQLVWAFTTGDDVRAAPAIGRDGTVFIGSFDSMMYAINRDGTLAWSFRTGDRILSSALVDANGAVLFGSEDDRLYALEADGHSRWSVELGGDIDSSPVLAADGTIYVGSDDKKLYALHTP